MVKLRLRDRVLSCLLVLTSLVSGCRRDSESPSSAVVSPNENARQAAATDEDHPDGSDRPPALTDPSSKPFSDASSSLAGAVDPAPREELPDGPLSDVRRDVQALHREELDVAERFLRDFPNEGDAEALLGSVYLNQGRSVEALECWQQCVQKQPQRLEAYDALAILALQRGEFERVVELSQQMLAVEPQLRGLRNRLARALLALGRTSEAAEQLKQEVRLNPQSTDSLFLLGRAYALLEQDQKAYASLSRAIELNPNHPQACYQMAAICERLDRPDEAQRYRHKFQTLQTAARIEVQGRKGRDSESVDLQAVRRSVATTEAVAAGLYLRRGNPSRARDLLQRAIELHPENPQFHVDFGALLAHVGELAAAEQSFRRAIEVAPDRSLGYEQLARLYLAQRKQLAEAKHFAEVATRMSPTAPNYYLLARACYETGDKPGALESIDRALALDPNNSEYRQVHAMLRQGQ